jgi:hypothetical protein
LSGSKALPVPAREEAVETPLAPGAVLAHSRAWLDRLFGPEPAPHLFLVGGTFKTLLHGRPAHDVDLWAPTPEARGRLIDALLRRGATRLRDNPPFQEVLLLEGQRIDISYDTRHRTMEGLLRGCDIALSAIGYERSTEGERCCIHSLAVESARLRRVLLLAPLANWKYALYTLERLRRYGRELGYEVRPEEEELIWATFVAQPPDVRRGMIDRYKRVSDTLPDILRLAEARCTR